MAKKNNNVKFNVGLTDKYFDAVSRQNLPMCAAADETIDNGFSNAIGLISMLVAIVKGHDKNLIGMVIADWGKGMSKEKLRYPQQVSLVHCFQGAWREHLSSR